MSEQRQHHSDAVRQRVMHLLKIGTSVSNIVARMHVSQTYVKGVRAELKSLRRKQDQGE